MAKKNSKAAGDANFVCPSCKNEVKPTICTITGISPQKCKCGKFLVIPIWLSALILGLCFSVWYGALLLVGVILPLIVQIFLIPVWAFFGYRISRKVVFFLVTARDIKQ